MDGPWLAPSTASISASESPALGPEPSSLPDRDGDDAGELAPEEALADAALGWTSVHVFHVEQAWTLAAIFGKLFWPLAWLISKTKMLNRMQ